MRKVGLEEIAVVKDDGVDDLLNVGINRVGSEFDGGYIVKAAV